MIAMETIILGTGSKDFSNIIEMQEYGYNDLLDCKVKVLNIFAKMLSQIEVAVFGDYQIYIFYKHGSNKKANNYKIKTIKKSFYEIIPYKEIFLDNRIVNESEKITEQVSFEPSCKLNLNEISNHNPLYKIDVHGKIEVSYVLDEASNFEVNDKTIIEPKEKAKIEFIEPKEEENTGIIENEKEEKIQSTALEIDEKKDYLINELIDMDLESLKKLVKISYSNLTPQKE